MPINRITASEFADQIATGVNERDKNLDTAIGPIRDLFIDPFAYVLENQNDRAVYLNNLMSLKNASNLVPDDLDDIVFNENIVRWAGSRAVTTVLFSRINPPVADITVPVNFPVATKVNPDTGTSIIFRTVETKTMYSSEPSKYWNPESNRYELEVAVASIVQGVTASVGPYTITEMRRPLSGIDEVYNIAATTSGRSIETNKELADRYLLHIEGSQIGTPSGLKRFILDNISTVTDAYVVYGDSIYLTRAEADAGAVDIWVLGNIPATRDYITRYNGTYTLNSVDFQPLISVSKVISGGTTYTEGVDYEVITGEGEYSYSNVGSDGIRWLPGGAHPDIGDSIIISYSYNSLINIIDAFFRQEEYYLIGSDVLFRWAQPTRIEIEASLKVRSGSPATVLGLVKAAIMNYVNSLKLGENVEEFDIDSVVSKIYGVDNWVYTKLAVKGSYGVSDIVIEPRSYAALSLADLVVSLV